MNPTRSRRSGSAALVEPGQVDSPEVDLALVDGFQAGQAVQQGGLARAGGAHHGAEPAAAEADRDAVQRGDHGRPGAVGLGDLDGAGGELDGPGRGGTDWLVDMAAPASGRRPVQATAATGGRPHWRGASIGVDPALPPPGGGAHRCRMGIRTAWQAIAQPPGRFLASSWPWRSLAYLLCGIAPSRGRRRRDRPRRLAVLAGRAGRPAPGGAGPAGFRTGRGPVRALAPAAGPHRPRPRPAAGRGAGHRPWRPATAVVCVVVLWLIDLAVVALSLFLSAGLTVTALRSADSGGGVQAAMLAAVALLPVAAYPVTAWAGARSALARPSSPPGAGAGPAAGRGHPVAGAPGRRVRAGRRRIERDLHDGAQQRLVALTVALGLARLDLAPGSPPRRGSTPPTSRPGRRWRSCGS